MASAIEDRTAVWQGSLIMWIAVLGAWGLLAVLFYDALAPLVARWSRSEEYGYGFFVPFITAFFIWQKRNTLQAMEFENSWLSLIIVVFGFGLYLVGELSALYIVVQYSFLIVLYGVILALTGWRVLREVTMPLLLLLFTIPLPQFLYQELSDYLQRISTEFGVMVIRLFGISVYMEGNIIDLGTYRLQVVEACSGLRYLFPLSTFAFIAAYLFRAALWKRTVIFLSSVPITIIMNSFRIGVIGILVEHWGSSMAEGFLHSFQGWAVFMASVVILVGEMWLLTRLGASRRPLRDSFYIQFPEAPPEGASIRYRELPGSFLCALTVLVAAAVLVPALNARSEIVVERKSFYQFPDTMGNWKGEKETLGKIYVDALKLDDYVLSNYADGSGHSINLYAAYYGSQRKGESAHSPRSCLPGGGWHIEDFGRRDITVRGERRQVNRALIQKDGLTQLVYYWFSQRGRHLTNEYMVKGYLLWDAVTRNRTDGALVRLMTPVRPGEDIADADRLLSEFSVEVSQRLDSFVPD